MLHRTAITLTLALSLVLSTVRGVQFPAPKGPFEIGTTTLELTDHSRLDPFAPTRQSRIVQLSVHYPIAKGSAPPFSTYLPRLTAQDAETTVGLPAGTLQNISTHARLNASILHGGQNTPVILFSPGAGVSRLLYASFVQDLASEGYAVISIDHLYDASIVELSDGRVVIGNPNITDTLDAINLDLAVRAADARFVIDEVASARHFKIPGLKSRLDTNHVGFFGHSLGGATAATTMVLDHRVVAGVNMDGSFFGPDVQRGFAKPFVIMASEGHNRTTDPSWGAVWEKLRGFKRELEVKGALHLTYTDGPVLSDALGVQLPAETFGTIAAEQFDDIQHAYLTAFFDFALRGKREKLLDGPSKEFPEVSFI